MGQDGTDMIRYWVGVVSRDRVLDG
ncbi:EVE domain-containing protein, partial [Clavibacter phaseoli]